MTSNSKAVSSVQAGYLDETAPNQQVNNTPFPAETQLETPPYDLCEMHDGCSFIKDLEYYQAQVPAAAEEFLTLLDEEAEEFLFCAFHDTDRAGLPYSFYSSFEGARGKLIELNNHGYGIFVAINKTQGKSRKKENITGIRAVWQEQDQPLYSELPIEPHIVVQTSPGKHHRYILIDNAVLDEFEEVQQRLVDDFGSDTNAKDRSRVLRLPGFFHQKNPDEPHLVRIVAQSNAMPMPWDEVKKIFPPIRKDTNEKKTGQQDVDLDKICNALDTLDPDIGYQQWLDVGMALHDACSGSDEGLALWDNWSSISKKGKYKHGECDTKWSSFKGEGITVGTLFNMAAEEGWKHQDKDTASDTSEQVEEDEETKEKSIAQIVVKAVTASSVLVHDSDDRAYAILSHEDHSEVWPLDSEQFKKWINRTIFKKYNKVPNTNAFTDALNVLSGHAIYDGEKVDVHVRTAVVAGQYYLDLCNDEWNIIKITPDAWQVTEAGEEVYFRRTSTMRSLPIPEVCSCRELPYLLSCHLNITESEIRLMIAVIISAFMPDTEYPILEISGSPGSGKSTIQEMIRCCVDPNKVNLRAAPGKVEDIFISAINNHVVSYNNLSQISNAQSDAFCSLATGGGHAGRTLYTNTEETASDVKKPVIFNGIMSLAKMPDLIDRLIKVSLQPIASTENKPKKKVMDDFLADLPNILGSLLDLFCKVLKLLPTIKLEKLPRMADFALLCEAITQVYGWTDKLLDTYYQNRADSFVNALEASPALMAVVKFMGAIPLWEGTVGQLHEIIANDKKDGDGWVKSPRGLGERLRMHSSALKAIGLVVYFDPIRHNDGYHIKITKDPAIYSRHAPPSQEVAALPPWEKKVREGSEGSEGQKTSRYQNAGAPLGYREEEI